MLSERANDFEDFTTETIARSIMKDCPAMPEVQAWEDAREIMQELIRDKEVETAIRQEVA